MKTLQTPFLNLDPFQQWYRIENIVRVKINGESCMALLDNGAQVNTIMLRYVSDHSLQVGPITNPHGFQSHLHGARQSIHKTIGLHHDLGSG